MGDGDDGTVSLIILLLEVLHAFRRKAFLLWPNVPGGDQETTQDVTIMCHEELARGMGENERVADLCVFRVEEWG